MVAVISSSDVLLAQINNKKARVGVIGLGVVGAAQAVAMTHAGFTVIGVDIDPERVAALTVTEGGVASQTASEGLHATSDFNELEAADCVIICVPTSHTADGAPNLTALTKAAQAVAQQLTVGTLVVLESTVPPTTTRELVLPILEKSGLRVGEDFFLAFSPERLDLGNTTYPVEAIPRVVGGITPSCTEVACALYQQLAAKIHPVSSPEAAEMAKVFENTFRYVNIGLANELALLCSAMSLSVHEVLDACATKPFAFMTHRPGPGVGGRCIPMAPRYMSWVAQESGKELPVTEAAMRVNDAMPHVVAQRVQALIGDGKSGEGRPSVLILGVAYKPNVADARGSVALTVAGDLLRAGVRVLYHDPHVPSISVEGQQLLSQELESRLIEDVDCTVLLCPHESVDYELILRHSSRLLDPTGHLTPDGQRVFHI